MDTKPLWTGDVAAMRIQGMWQTRIGKQFMRSLVRKAFKRLRNMATGQWYFRNDITGTMTTKLPSLLGGELWDPNDMREWGVFEMEIWSRPRAPHPGLPVSRVLLVLGITR